MNQLVSVITPAYNSRQYIRQAIQSVQRQTYPHWEMIVVDDASTDDTCAIVALMAQSDARIRLIRLSANGGAATARNTAMDAAAGRFIAFLDADDLWLPEKLARQVAFMLARGCGFSCTSYEVINDSGAPLHKTVHMLAQVDYKAFLMNNLLQTVGIMVDVAAVGKAPVHMPDMRRRQDAATWLQILKAGHVCHGMPDVLAQYRRAQNSLSSNRYRAVSGVWYLYRKVERLPLLFSIHCFIRYAALAVWKRLYHGAAPESGASVPLPMQAAGDPAGGADASAVNSTGGSAVNGAGGTAINGTDTHTLPQAAAGSAPGA